MVFIVESLSDLVKGGPSIAKLVVWLHIIANGRRVVEEVIRDRTRQFLPSIRWSM